MTLLRLSRQRNAFDYSSLHRRTVGSHPVKGSWNQGEVNPLARFTIAKWGFLRGSSNSLLHQSHCLVGQFMFIALDTQHLN